MFEVIVPRNYHKIHFYRRKIKPDKIKINVKYSDTFKKKNYFKLALVNEWNDVILLFLCEHEVLKNGNNVDRSATETRSGTSAKCLIIMMMVVRISKDK